MSINVSIIIPMLNVAKYIGECLSSVVNSTMKEIEIICVDAGSTDGTIDILNDYSECDNRIRIIKSQRKSYGEQVNIGIKNAKGRYIGFVDGDDFVDTNMWKKLYDTAELNDFPDYVKADHDMFINIQGERVYKKVSTFDEIKKQYYNRVLNPKNIPHLLVIDTYMWKGIYKKEFLDNNHIVLNCSEGAAYQDCGFLFQTINSANRVVYIPDSLYRYRRDNENASIYDYRGIEYVYQEFKYIYEIASKYKNVNSEVFFNYYKRYYKMLEFRIEFATRNHLKYEAVKVLLEKIREDFIEGYRNNQIRREYFTQAQWINVCQLIESAEKYYEYHLFMSKIKDEETRNFILECRQYKKIVIFGAGNCGGTLLYHLKNASIADKIVGWCDNDVNKKGKKYMGLDIFSLDDLLANKNDEYTFIITAGVFWMSIKSQLLDNGISPSNIVLYTLGHDPLDVGRGNGKQKED